VIRAFHPATGLLLAAALLSSPVEGRRALQLRPFAEYEPTGVLVMSADDSFGAAAAKRAIAAHLPPGVSLVLYGPDDEDARRDVLTSYAPHIAPDRVRYLALARTGAGFWTRDALPLAAWDQNGRMVLIDARYRSGFEPDARVAALLGAPLLGHGRRFDAGNFAANDRGQCLVVDAGPARDLEPATLRSYYGCRDVLRLPRRGGIGHADERVRFVDARTVLTDTPDYVPLLTSRGLVVVMLPRADGRRESYVNAVVINGTAFVPQFRRETDGAALDVYRRLGLTVIGIDTRALAGRGHGAIHCITMTYPVGASAAGLDQVLETLEIRDEG
jgi:hypothetical protein